MAVTQQSDISSQQARCECRGVVASMLSAVVPVINNEVTR
jgi:hypothetical protein